MNVTDQRDYEEKLSSWQRERDRQKVEFTITENDLDADLRLASPEVLLSSTPSTDLDADLHLTSPEVLSSTPSTDLDADLHLTSPEV